MIVMYWKVYISMTLPHGFLFHLLKSILILWIMPIIFTVTINLFQVNLLSLRMLRK